MVSSILIQLILQYVVTLSKQCTAQSIRSFSLATILHQEETHQINIPTTNSYCLHI